MSPTSSTHVDGESDGRVVPMKGPNKDGQPSAEGLEGRRPTKENTEQPTPPRTQSRTSESSGLLGVREVGTTRTRGHGSPRCCTTSTSTQLRESFYALKREAAPGVDGVTWREYETDLEANADGPSRPRACGDVSSAAVQESLHPESRWATASARASRPWRTRSSSRPSVAVLNADLRGGFLGFSYGFRPGRSQHDALDALWVGHHAEAGELGARRGHPWLLRHDRPRMDDASSSSTGLRTDAIHAPHPEMAEGGRARRTGPGRRRRRVRRKGRWHRHCSRTSTCTTCSTSGSSDGGSRHGTRRHDCRPLRR